MNPYIPHNLLQASYVTPHGPLKLAIFIAKMWPKHQFVLRCFLQNIEVNRRAILSAHRVIIWLLFLVPLVLRIPQRFYLRMRCFGTWKSLMCGWMRCIWEDVSKTTHFVFDRTISIWKLAAILQCRPLVVKPRSSTVHNMGITKLLVLHHRVFDRRYLGNCWGLTAHLNRYNLYYFYEHTADDCKHFEMLKFSLQKYDSK